jgi:serine-type D-Ala-D-Ala endopeptidase (penicillin-binding protein 7)
MLEFISQLVLAALMTQLSPVDAAQFEWFAGEGSVEDTVFSQEEVLRYATGLPESGLRMSVEYPVKVDEESFGIVTSARSHLVQDAQSGMTLVAKHPYEVRAIGSVTKLMTAMVFLDQNPDLASNVALDPALDLVTGGRVYLAFYDELVLEDVLAASLVGSDNTATYSLMRFSGLEESAFIEAMNVRAAELGMDATTFMDPTGIDAGNVSTATDIVKLLRASEAYDLIADYTTRPDVVVTQDSGRTIDIGNTNTLLEGILMEGESDILVGKTGFLPQAGYVLAAAVEQDGEKVYVVVMGSESKDARADEVKGLALWAFKTFNWPEL